MQLVCIPCLFLYHHNFVPAQSNSCLIFFIFLTHWLQYYSFLSTNQRNFTNVKGHWTIFIETNGGICICIYVLYCICICVVLYLYLWQPMMMERGLWNFACAQICLNLVTPLQCIVDHIICNSTFTQKQNKKQYTIHWNSIQH